MARRRLLQSSRKRVCNRQAPPFQISPCEQKLCLWFGTGIPTHPPRTPTCPVGQTGQGPLKQILRRKSATGLGFDSGCGKGRRKNEKKVLLPDASDLVRTPAFGSRIECKVFEGDLCISERKEVVPELEARTLEPCETDPPRETEPPEL